MEYTSTKGDTEWKALTLELKIPASPILLTAANTPKDFQMAKIGTGPLRRGEYPPEKLSQLLEKLGHDKNVIKEVIQVTKHVTTAHNKAVQMSKSNQFATEK